MIASATSHVALWGTDGPTVTAAERASSLRAVTTGASCQECEKPMGDGRAPGCLRTHAACAKAVRRCLRYQGR